MATNLARPQIGIDRLPTRRVANEPREAMNCKSCRKRKIKCNRTRPACEACQVFACPCVYDAVPKKRGPKTDVLEALLKRVDGLEKRLHAEGKSDVTIDAESSTAQESSSESTKTTTPSSEPPRSRSNLEIAPNAAPSASQLMSPTEPSVQTPTILPDLLLDTYFTRVHGKPYHILDETITRQRLQANQLPVHLAYAIYAVSARYTPHFGGYNAAAKVGQEYARRSRLELDIDEPSIEALQTLMLLAQANFQNGQGKKTFMLLTSAISMAFALDLHRELPLGLKVTPLEREGRRRLFWSCYLMDRFAATGSKRPSLIADESIVLRLPSWQLHPGAILLEGDFFSNGSNLQYMAGSGKAGQGSMGMLIGIAKILGITNRYLAAGGVKGDSHFPWHSLSNLSKIRQELDIWASETQDTFSSIDSLFGRPDSTILVLSKLVYHLIHCLIYRPFLPIDLAELSGTSQHQSWQIEATNLCFLHANAIAELVEIGRASSVIDWPAFVGYCVCTAGTIHVHGAYYPGREGEVFSSSPDFLSREMQQLSELRLLWAHVQHQRDTLQAIYSCHTELVKSLSSNPMRFSPVFQLEDFFDRYPGAVFDGAHVTFMEVQVDALHESNIPTYNLDQRNPVYLPTSLNNTHFPHPSITSSSYTNGPPTKKRRATTSSTTKPRVQPPPLHTSLQRQPSDPNPGPSSAPVLDPNDTPMQTPFTPTTASSLNPTQNNQANNPDLTTQLQQPTFSPPPFTFSPFPLPHLLDPTTTTSHPHLNPNPNNPNNLNNTNLNTFQNYAFDPMLSMPTPGAYEPHPTYEQQPTPGAASTGSTHTDDKDPFLSLLEQLAEGELAEGGSRELDFYLNAGGVG
ncbi:hypothetical protein M011DRAFT_495564 [Sporormia fimetaria CBS 119925]|uniref:Zn(2)-C6 fungal-type domain-containing protein n=1 Tax=Sporormia fimetaria CBS 119925 TaxID=1340428 RepID=A0A6A6V8Y5_9PLEO|nr:hypothetical protein M011DRAFT_495564 [Sporormia fimetaria CBS 119925]